MKNALIRLHWILNAQFGVDPQKTLRSLRGFPRFVRDYLRFRSTFKGRSEIVPCLHDWYEQGGCTTNEYFWQDLLVARKIFLSAPVKHVDIGSRVDGFVSHVASFREIEIFDIRPISTHLPGITFRQADLMLPVTDLSNYCDSLSCLHALEHFGLGRYGDPIDPHGYERGIANMARILKANGTFYISTPIGQERVEFNANRVFDPRSIIRCAEMNNLRLINLTLVPADGQTREIQLTDHNLLELAQHRYNLGIFIFTKLS
jgi:hypothetical protein